MVTNDLAYREFVDANNNDLLKNLGNLCNRVVKFCHAKLNAVVPDYRAYKDPDNSFMQYKEEVNSLLQTYIAHLTATKLRAGLSTILRYVSQSDRILTVLMTNVVSMQHFGCRQQVVAR